MPAIVNIGVGGWYPAGSARLRSYCEGFPLEFASELPSGYPTHTEAPYMMKVWWISRALQRHSSILWLDCSVVPLRPLADFVEYIEEHSFTKEHGVYAFRTGYTLGQSCNDNAFAMSGLPEEALGWPEFASTLFYVHKRHAVGAEVAYWFERLAKCGAIRGDRLHSPEESSRPEFLFHRQDQTCLTLAMYKTGVRHHGSDGFGDIAHCDTDPPKPGSWFVLARGEENLKCYPSASGAGSPTDCSPSSPMPASSEPQAGAPWSCGPTAETSPAPGTNASSPSTG